MARFYASFDNSTVSSIEAGTTDNFYQRLSMTNGSTIKSALVSARDALSAGMYAQLDTVNKNGLLGTTVPTNGYTISGGNFSGSPTNTVYTNSNAVWQTDPRAVRTTTSTVTNITVANSTAVSPLDPYSFSSTLYTNATTAVQNMLSAISPPSGFSGNGPYARIGLDSFRTLASIWTDHALTFVAWDDYTPGTVQSLTAVPFGTAGAFTVTASWLNYQYSNDENQSGKVRVQMSLGSTTGGNNYSFDSGLITPPLTKEVQWNFAPTADSYLLNVFVIVYDAVIPAHAGTAASVLNQAITVV
jgi:hypothetical protein